MESGEGWLDSLYIRGLLMVSCVGLFFLQTTHAFFEVSATGSITRAYYLSFLFFLFRLRVRAWETEEERERERERESERERWGGEKKYMIEFVNSVFKIDLSIIIFC